MIKMHHPDRGRSSGDDETAGGTSPTIFKPQKTRLIDRGCAVQWIFFFQ
jgi:hypothetical protein